MAKASIIIPVYNKEEYLKNTLICVDGQTEDDLEIIIIDDASTDKSMDIVYDFVNNTKKQTKVIKNDKNFGVAYSRNIGIEESKTDYITFLDADDILERNFMEVMLNKARKYPFVDLIRGVLLPFKSGDGILDDGELEGYYEEQLIIPKIKPEYIFEEIISCSARLYKSDFVKNLRFFESCFEDYEFFLETMINCNSILYTNESQYGYRFISNGKYQSNVFNLEKSCLEYFDIFDRVLKKYPDIDSSVSEILIKKQLDMCMHYLKNVGNTNITSKDKCAFIEYYLMYFHKCYGLQEEIIERIIGKRFIPIDDVEAIRVKIKEIASKY